MKYTQSDINKAWAAGFWDGEGCVSSSKRKYPYLVVGQAGDEALILLARFASALEIEGAVHKLKYQSDKHKPYWRITFSGYDKVSHALEVCRPWLSQTKIEQAEFRLSETYEKRKSYVHAQRKKTHCPSGHEYSEINTYVKPSTGERRCKTCTSAYQRKYQARRKLEKSLS